MRKVLTKRADRPITWQTALLRETFATADKRPRVMPNKKAYSRKGRRAQDF